MRLNVLFTLAGAGLVGLALSVGCGESNPGSSAFDSGASDATGPSNTPGFGSNDRDQASTLDAAAGCATTTKKVETTPLDMVIGLDTSFSMDFDDKWSNVREAMKSFVTNPAYSDLGIGLQFFPIRKQCDVVEYATLAVPVGLQPAVAPAIVAALDARKMSGGTPMVPLLQGLISYLESNAKPGRRPVIVLATDGVPDDTCLPGGGKALPNSLENAVVVASSAFTGALAIPVFVIGVGGELTALDAIAAAGGTTKATTVDTGSNAAADFLKALDTIRKQSIPCDYAIPETAIDPAKTNVKYTQSSGTTENLVFVEGAANCDKAPSSGWYFNDEKNPKKVILCGGTCEHIKGDDRGQIDVVFGCPRVDVK